MRLEAYWGVGPKTRERLEAELGVEAAVDAIESADVRALSAAGVGRGRATRILRHARGGESLDLLATGDARDVYKELLALAREHAVTRQAADRISVLTPLDSVEAMEARLDDVIAARDAWAALDDPTRAAVLAAFDDYDSVAGGEREAVETALALRETGVQRGPFAAFADLDAAALADAVSALSALDDGTVREGADERLDELRETRAALETLVADVEGVLADVRDAGVRGTGEFREAFAEYVADETGIGPAAVREAAPDAADAEQFVAGTLDALIADRREAVAERADAVRADVRDALADVREEIDRAVAVVDDVALDVSLARFALAFDLVRPEFVGTATLAVADARNLSLAADGIDVRPVTYALGDHSLDADPEPPVGDRVAVLTGANSGGKTTLLETLCQVALLARMGLPVPAERAQVGPVDRVVFHRRHASFNAGVLESTLRSVVPPLAGDGRTLMLVDEFEAITEPGSAADLLHGLVTLTVDRDALGAFVTHLADDLEPLPGAARIDGIFAEGLTPDLDLSVDYQPRFGEVGRSTPEFIVSRLVADAGSRRERACFETLAGAVGEEAVQRTLADARWSG